jgi:autotransporter translocation and assembly factor TamB
LSGDLTVNALDSFYYDIRVAIPQEFPFKYDLDEIEGVVMDTLFVRGETPPTVSGHLTLVSGKYQVEFAEEGAGSPLMLALSGENMWDLDINIEIPSNYWIKNEDIDAEFAGFLNIIREKGKYRFVGELDILRGRGFLFDKTFSISPDSSSVIFEDVEYPNPRLDIWASTRVPLARTSEQERSYEDVKVHVTGNLDNPEFSFFLAGEEDVPISYEAIVPLIVANYYGDASTNGAFEERLSQLVSTQISQIGTRRLGVETFEIDPTYEGYVSLAQTRVTVGKYAGSNLYLWGRSSVEFQDLPAAGFEYRISKALLLEGIRDEDPDEGESYRLNLKMHWEFK